MGLESFLFGSLAGSGGSDFLGAFFRATFSSALGAMGNQASVPTHLQAHYVQGQTVRSTQVEIPNMTPRELFGLEKNYNLEQLKNAYKRLVLLVHPDKGGSEAMFQHVTDCFRILYTELQSRESEKTHAELKAAYVQAVPVAEQARVVTTFDKNGKFSSAAFNKFYEDNRLEDEEADFGYGSTMASSSKTREDIEIPKEFSKFSSKRFHETFEKKVQPTGTAVTVYEEPEALVLAKKLNFVELGKKADDYSSDMSKGGVQYMDYMRAHTTTRLVDPTVVKTRKDFKTVEQFEEYREKATSKQYSDEELARKKQREEEERAQEEERQRRLRERDVLQQQHFTRISGLLGRA